MSFEDRCQCINFGTITEDLNDCFSLTIAQLRLSQNYFNVFFFLAE